MDDAASQVRSTDRRNDEPRAQRDSDVIDAEVIAVEVHGQNTEFQDSLDQIEKLAAELKEIAEVITPSPNPQPRPEPHQARPGRRRQSESRQPHTVPVAAPVPPVAPPPEAPPRRPRPSGPKFAPQSLPPDASPRSATTAETPCLFSWRGPDPAPPRASAAAVGASIVQAPSEPPPVESTVEFPTVETPPRASTEVDVAETVIAAVATRPATAPQSRRPEPPSGPRRPPTSRRAPRRRYIAIIIGAAALAIPAFALGAVQPWHSTGDGNDQLSVVNGNRADERPLAAGEPGPAVANNNSNRSDSGKKSDKPSGGSSSEVSQPSAQASPSPSQAQSSPPPSTRKNAPAGLSIRVTADNVQPTVGDAVTFTVTWEDGSGHYAGTTQDWGDGSAIGGSVTVGECSGDAPADSGTASARHTYTQAGTYTATVSLTTYTCNGGTETRSVSLTITVVADQPSSSPSPPPSPTPSQTPSSPAPSTSAPSSTALPPSGKVSPTPTNAA